MDVIGNCRVYNRLTKTKPDGNVIKLRIQEMPEENLQDVMDLLEKHFLVEEPVHRSSGVYLNKDAVNEYNEITMSLLGLFKPHIVICCEVDENDEIKKIAGASVMHIATEMMDLRNIPTQTKEIKKLFEMAINTFYAYDPVTEHNVEKFFDDVFIVVHPDYRRLGIAHKFVQSRRLICKEQNVPLAIGWMSAKGTQRAAEADNWEVVKEISYEELAKKYDVVFDNAPPTTKLMIAWP